MIVAHRRTLVAVSLVLAAVLAACGSDDDDSASTTQATALVAVTSTTSPAVASTSTPPTSPLDTDPLDSSTPDSSTPDSSTPDSSAPDTDAASDPTTAATPPATEPPTTVATTTSTTISDAPHTVVHAMGSTEVVGNPTSVVVLDSSFLDASVALGLVPVGATEGLPGRGLPAYLGEEVVDRITLVGDTTTPNLELIATLEPDLIIGSKVRNEATYDALTQIAPTVFSESSGRNWRDQVTLTAEAINRAPQAVQLLEEFDVRAAAVGEKIAAAGKTASIVRFIPGQTRLYGPETFSGSVLTQVGFDLGDKGFDPNVGMALISQEQVQLVDSDYIFATAYAEADSARTAFEGLWATLPAIQAGHQFDIPEDTWMTGIGVLGANHILDDLETWVAP